MASPTSSEGLPASAAPTPLVAQKPEDMATTAIMVLATAGIKAATVEATDSTVDTWVAVTTDHITGLIMDLTTAEEADLDQCHLELATGSAAPKAVDTTTSPKMLLAFAVVLPGLELLWLPIQALQEVLRL